MSKSLDSQDISDGGVVGAISALIRAEHQHAAVLATKMGLPSADTLSLYHLANEPLTASALGQRLSLTSGSVTTLIDRLVTRRLARRIAHPVDRRVVLVELTNHGHAQSWKVLQHFIGDIQRLAATFNSSEQATIERFLQQLTETIVTDTARMRETQ
jgi:DNA-binding MarR family transcriptional regulator